MEQLLTEYRKEREKYGLINSKLCTQKDRMTYVENRIKNKLMPIIKEMYNIESSMEFFRDLLTINEKPINEPTEIDYSSVRIKNGFVYVRYNYYHRYSCGDYVDIWSKIKFPVSYLDMSWSDIRTAHTKFIKNRIENKMIIKKRSY